MNIDIYDPDIYASATPYDDFALLRRDFPVYRQIMPNGSFYWAVTRYADVVEVSRQPEKFSAEVGGVILEDQSAEQLEQSKNMLLMMDPPRHSKVRKTIYPYFRPGEISRLEDRIREICIEILTVGLARKTVEFVHDLAAQLPAQILGELMGIPPKDRAQINHWAEIMIGSQDPDINPSASNAAEKTLSPNEGSIAMAMYGMEFARSRRESNRSDRDTDLGDLLLATQVDGRSMTDLEFAYFFVQLVTAGNDTTRTMISSGLLTLIEHPDQLAALRETPHLCGSALEEILRYSPPLHYFRRTATADTQIGEQVIKAGEKVALMYSSANRDEAVFSCPDEFDITRSPNAHLSFGIGEHFCLGVHLARMEGRVFLEEMLNLWPKIELAGAPKRQRSNLNNALKSLPIRVAGA
jgi:cytochrome P450